MTTWTKFRWLAAAKFVSDLGTYFDMVALYGYVYLLTGSSAATALFLATRLGAGFLFGFYAGVLADRVSRKRLLVGADLARSAALLSLALVPASAHFPLLFAVAFVLGAGNAVFDVSLGASVPAIVGPEHRVRANGLLVSMGSLAMAIGCATSGVFLTVFSYRWAFAFDALTYLFSAAVLLRLDIRTRETDGPVAASPAFLSELRAVSGYVAAIPPLFAMLVIRLADALGSAAHNVGLPVLAKALDPARPTLYLGLVYATWALGKLGGSLVAAGSRRGERLKAPGVAERLFGLSTMAMSAAFVALFWARDPALLLALSALAGLADGLSEVGFVSRLQACPDAMRGRLFGVATTALTVGFGGGMLLCAPFFDRFAPAAVVSVFHGVPLVLAAAFLFFLSKWKGDFFRREE